MIYTNVTLSSRDILVYLASLVTVWQVAVSGESSGSERFAWIWVLWTLKKSRFVPQLHIWKDLLRLSILKHLWNIKLPGCQEGCCR